LGVFVAVRFPEKELDKLRVAAGRRGETLYGAIRERALLRVAQLEAKVRVTKLVIPKVKGLCSPLAIRVSPRDYKRIERAAATEGASPGIWIRAVALA